MKKLLIVLLGLTSLNVYANGCGGEYQPATGTCRIIDSSGRQILYNVGSPQSSNRGSYQIQPNIINIKVPSKYGAWAVNLNTGIAGGALDMDLLETAKREAIKTCERGGKNAPCTLEIWALNVCIAVAQGKSIRKSGKKWKLFSVATDPGEAEAQAIQKCQAAGHTQCRIVAPEGCSLPKF